MRSARIEGSERFTTLDDIYSGRPPPQPPPPPPPSQLALEAPAPGPPATPPADSMPQRQAAPATPPAQSSPDDSDEDSGNAAMAAARNPAPDSAPTSAVDSTSSQPAAAGPATDGAGVPANPTALREMPDDFRANFPQFNVDVVAYNASPEKRFVLIDGKRYHEGDALPQGPQIAEIVPQGIVFGWQGHKVLYPAQP